LHQQNRNLNELLYTAKQIEGEFSKLGKKWVSINHELEIYLMEFYEENFDYSILSQPLHRVYYEISLQYKKKQAYSDMWDSLEKAYSYNHADMEILYQIVRVFYTEKNYKSMFYMLQNAYPYIYTRRDMGEYYKLLACYFLETYQPDIAEAVYMYSNYFYKNKQADQDLCFIEDAVHRKRKMDSPDEIKKYLVQKGIPVQPSEQTLGMVYQVAIMHMKQKNKEYAKQLLFALYQLTQDSQIKEMLN
jgi:hypothetical protein